MKRALFVFFIFSLIFLISPLSPKALALKKRIRAPKIPGVSYSSARLSRLTNSVIVTFLHLDKTKRVDYVLSYTANGISQGAMGAIVPTGQINDSRDLYFGTCSHGVCTPHYNIRNAKLTITTTLTTGATYIKRYIIKI
jgi:hypothetical protein